MMSDNDRRVRQGNTANVDEHPVRRAAGKLIVLCGALLSTATHANSIEATPTNWRLENYVSDHRVVLWYTPAPECSNGHLSGALSQEDNNRLWSLVLTAKLNNSRVGIYYNVNGGSCEITSFYAP